MRSNSTPPTPMSGLSRICVGRTLDLNDDLTGIREWERGAPGTIDACLLPSIREPSVAGLCHLRDGSVSGVWRATSQILHETADRWMRGSATASLQVADSPNANARFSGQILLDQPGGVPETAKQRAEVGCAGSWHGPLPDENLNENWVCQIISMGAHYRWWFEHIPKITGETDGISNNWREYRVDPNRVESTDCWAEGRGG